MADFCAQHSIELFDEDFGDFKGLCGPDECIQVLCESCGPVYVNHKGQSIDEEATANAYRGPDQIKVVLRSV